MADYYELRVRDEESWLQWMISRNQRDDELIAQLSAQAKDSLWWFKQDGDESHLKRAEQFSEMAQNIKKCKYTITDIRKQRELIQWVKKQARPSSEQSQSSSHSES